MRSLPQAARVDLPLLDVLRLVASVAIVRHHVRGDLLLGVGFGLPLFLVILFGLAAGSTRAERFGAFARRKVRYLGLPWLRWSLLYVVLLSGADLVGGQPLGERFEPQMIFYGGHPSLWFLPFAAVALLPLEGVRRWVRDRPPEVVGVVACVLGAAVTHLAAVGLTADLPDQPARAWLRMSPALFYGLALGQSMRVSEPARMRLLTSIALAATCAYLLSPMRGHAEDLPRRFAAAVPLACLGFGWRSVACRPAALGTVRRAATLTFGIYLVHPLVGKALGRALDVFAWPAAAHAALAWGLAAAIVLVLRRTPLAWHELSTTRRPSGVERASQTSSEPGRRAA